MQKTPDPTRPHFMIYLIGGAPRCGKTILSKKIAAKKRVSFISTDVLRPMIMASFPKDEWVKRFPKESIKTPKGKFRFEVLDAKTSVRLTNLENRTIWPPIKTLIEKLIEREEDCVIEGADLIPRFVHQVKGTTSWDHIRVAYVVKTDLEKIKSGFSATLNGVYDWMYPHIKDDDDRLTMVARYVQGYGDFFESEAKKYGFKVFNTQDQFKRTLNEALEYLL